MVKSHYFKYLEQNYNFNNVSNQHFVEGLIYPVSINEEERRKEIIIRAILDCLEKDFRISLTQIHRRTKIPISTIYEHLKRIRKHYQLVLIPKQEVDLNGKTKQRRN